MISIVLDDLSLSVVRVSWGNGLCLCLCAGRVHSATVKTVSVAKATVHVEWTEKEATKGKEVEKSHPFFAVCCKCMHAWCLWSWLRVSVCTRLTWVTSIVSMLTWLTTCKHQNKQDLPLGQLLTLHGHRKQRKWVSLMIPLISLLLNVIFSDVQWIWRRLHGGACWKFRFLWCKKKCIQNAWCVIIYPTF